jgi:hypothetical protein
MEILLSVLYSLLFVLLIHKMKFFETTGLSKKFISGIFILKIFFGILLWGIYTYYYTDRSTADIFKYFDDSKVMFDALRQKPADFIRLMTGIGNDTPHFDIYYSQMHNWVRQYESNLYNDSHTIIRMNAFFRIFSFGYYQVHAIFLCFLSLSGLVALYKSFAYALTGRKKLAIACIFLFPSVLFWGSGVLKEGIIFFGLGMLIYHWFRLLYKQFSFYSLLWVVFSFAVLLATKFYILVSIVPGLLYIAWIALGGRNRLVLKFLVVMSVYAGLGLGVKYFLPAYDPLQVLVIKQQDFTSLAKGGALLRTDTAIVYLTLEQRTADLEEIDHTKTYHIRTGTRFCYWHDYNADADTLFGQQTKNNTLFTMENDIPRSGSLIHLNPLKPTVASFLRNTPMALVNSLFRPFPNEAGRPLLIGPAVEIIFYTGFILCCLLYRRRSGAYWEYMYFCLSFVFILFLITGLTTPVLGALVRYKVPGIPFLALAFLFILDEERLKKQFPFLKRFLTE